MLVMWHVWLVWILTTKHKSLNRVENFERYAIFSSYNFVAFINQTVFVLLCALVFWICSYNRFTPWIFILFNLFRIEPWLFIFLCNFLGTWNDAQIFVFAESTLVSIQFSYWRCDHPFWPALSGDGEDHQ